MLQKQKMKKADTKETRISQKGYKTGNSNNIRKEISEYRQHERSSKKTPLPRKTNANMETMDATKQCQQESRKNPNTSVVSQNEHACYLLYWIFDQASYLYRVGTNTLHCARTVERPPARNFRAQIWIHSSYLV